MDYATFFSTYGDDSGTFQNNTNRQISEQDLRQFASDILNTFSLGASASNIDTQEIEIGDFNIPASPLGKEVYVGPSSMFPTIKYSTVQIRNDGDTAKYTSPYFSILDDSVNLRHAAYINGASSVVNILANGYTFAASANFDATNFNRGYVTLFF